MTSEDEIEDLFVFAIPLLPRSRAANWQRVLDNLQATLQSILNQKDQNFLCLLAVEDPIPLPEISNPKVIVFNVAHSKRMIFDRDDHKQSNRDAWRKRSLLMSLAKSLQAKYVMFADADDLLSDRVVDRTRTQKPEYGVALRCGYVMDRQSGNCLRVPSEHIPVEGFDSYCGTSIIHTLGDDQSEHARQFSSLWRKGHHLIRAAAIASGTPLLDFCDNLAIYMMNNGENLTMLQSNDTGVRSFAQQTIDNISRYGSPLTKAQLAEFGLWSS